MPPTMHPLHSDHYWKSGARLAVLFHTVWAHGGSEFFWGYLIFTIPLVKHPSLERNGLVEYQKKYKKRVECLGWYGVWFNFQAGQGRRFKQQQKIISTNYCISRYSHLCILEGWKNATDKWSVKGKVWSLLSRDDGIGKGIVLALDQDHPPLPSTLPKGVFS